MTHKQTNMKAYIRYEELNHEVNVELLDLLHEQGWKWTSGGEDANKWEDWSFYKSLHVDYALRMVVAIRMFYLIHLHPKEKNVKNTQQENILIGLRNHLKRSIKRSVKRSIICL